MAMHRIIAFVLWTLATLALFFITIVRVSEIRSIIETDCCKTESDGAECLEMQEESVRAFDKVFGIYWCAWIAIAFTALAAVFSYVARRAHALGLRLVWVYIAHSVAAMLSLATVGLFMGNVIFVTSLIHRQHWFSVMCTDNNGERIFLHDDEPDRFDIVSQTKSFMLWPTFFIVITAYVLDIVVPYVKFESTTAAVVRRRKR